MSSSIRIVSRLLRVSSNVFLLIAASAWAQPGPAPAPKSPQTETNRIADGVYSFRFDDHRSMFVVTSDGVIVTDPLNPRAAALMLESIRAVTPAPIRYMIYSNGHADHDSGGQVFKDAGARVISQEKCVDALKANPRAVPPDETFVGRRDIKLGETTIELHHFESGNRECLTIMRLPAQRLLYTVDIVTPQSVVFRDMPGDSLQTLVTLKALKKLDFDRIVPGHGPADAPASALDDAIGYFEDLMAQVKRAMATNPDQDAVKRAIDLSKYKDWRNAERFLMSNVDGMIRILKEAR